MTHPLRGPDLHEETFGPGGIVVNCDNADEALAGIHALGRNRIGTVHSGNVKDRAMASSVLRALEVLGATASVALPRAA